MNSPAAHKVDAAAVRERTEAVYRFMAAVTGDLPGFDEAARALFAGDSAQLEALVRLWPPDVRDELLRWLGASPPARG